MTACPTPTKVCYTSRKKAKRAMRAWSPRLGGKFAAYLCVCGAYHIGSVPAWVTSGEGTRDQLPSRRNK